MGGERQERLFVTCDVGENAGEKARFLGRDADRARVDPGERQEARKLCGAARDESECHDRQCARCLLSARDIRFSASGPAIAFHRRMALLQAPRSRRRDAGAICYGVSTSISRASFTTSGGDA